MRLLRDLEPPQTDRQELVLPHWSRSHSPDHRVQTITRNLLQRGRRTAKS
ncbi:MAG TPA: hypothetical protein VMM56_16175 [Planctomycetaceae bacterium]|nr:hypothetical protein [Planctomycetaceae bacterium]